MKIWQAGAVLLILALVLGVAMMQAGGTTFEALFSDCRSALGVYEPLLDFTVVDYRQPCERFYWLPYSGDEFYNPIRLNNFGMHDQPVTLDKPADTYRILLLGDEMTQALQVPLEQSFAALVEAALDTHPTQRVEIVNLSHSGYSTDRALLLYAVLGARFDADAVIHVVNLGDDVMQNHHPLEYLNLGTRPSRPYFSAGDDGLRLHNSPTVDAYASGAPAYEWLVAMQRQQGETVEAPPPTRPRVLRSRPYVVQYPVELGVYLPDDADWAQGWRITDELLRAFRDLVEQEGRRFGVVVIPAKLQIMADDWRADSNRYPILWDADPLAPSQRLDALLEAADIAYADLTWTLRSPRVVTNPDERLYYFWHPHLTAAGHRITAERVANWLRAEGFAP